MEARMFCELGDVIGSDAGIEIRLPTEQLCCSCLEIRGNRPDHAIESRATAIVGCIGCDLEGRFTRPLAKAKTTGSYSINAHADLASGVHGIIANSVPGQ